MALNADNVRVAVTGAVYYDGTSTATAPTGTGSSVTGMDDLGLVSEDGVSLKMPDAGGSTSLKAWQAGATVRTISRPVYVPVRRTTIFTGRVVPIDFARIGIATDGTSHRFLGTTRSGSWGRASTSSGS